VARARPENISVVLFEKKALPMSMVGFPLLLIPLAVYNIIVFLMPGVTLAEPLVTLTLMSGASWAVTLSDVLLALGILLLLFEVIKGARPGAKFLTDHLLSLIIFAGAAAEFLLLPRFGTSTYFLLSMLSLVDFLSGIALRARRGAAAANVSRPVARQAEAAPPEPRFDPPPAPAPVTETAPLERAEPKIEHPEIIPTPPSPEVSSPGLQPSDGTPPPPDAPPR
jgi:hypothetical protein